jgi:hypothetical protein
VAAMEAAEQKGSPEAAAIEWFLSPGSSLL